MSLMSLSLWSTNTTDLVLLILFMHCAVSPSVHALERAERACSCASYVTKCLCMDACSHACRMRLCVRVWEQRVGGAAAMTNRVIRYTS